MKPQEFHHPSAAVILAAGSGSRLFPLTRDIHKSLLPIRGKPVIEHALNSILEAGVTDVVVVLGHRSEVLMRFLNSRFPGLVRTVFNPSFSTDLNMQSVQIGVELLRDPARGYLIVETDLMLDEIAWRTILNIENPSKSFWVSKGRYSKSLTGGCVKIDARGKVLEIAYSPVYSEQFANWSKLLGVLYVGSENTQTDRELREASLSGKFGEYYMSTWVRNCGILESFLVDISPHLGGTFNDLTTFLEVKNIFDIR